MQEKSAMPTPPYSDTYDIVALTYTVMESIYGDGPEVERERERERDIERARARARERARKRERGDLCRLTPVARKKQIFEGLIDALGWGVFIGNVSVIVAWLWMAVQVSLSFLFFFLCLSLCLPACL
jgi:hypothetical protein